MPEKLKMHSPDMVQSNIDRIAELFPNCVTEAADDSGRVTRKIDFDLLRQELSDEIVEGPLERYHLNWPGKREAMLAANAPIAKTLRPCREESVDFDTTKNLFIEGDNLETLKLLQETYLGKVKMIYIDPPYNTGKEFIYDDNFADNASDYLQKSMQVESGGAGLVANPEANGRFHSDWLSMMFCRLKIARNILSEDGVILISIDDHEIANLREICDEIFGRKNFLATFVWNTEGNTDNQYVVKVNHEYVVAYLKNAGHEGESIGYVIDPNVSEDSNLHKGYADNNINKNNPENPPAVLTLPIGFPCIEDSLDYKAKVLDERFFQVTGEEKFVSDAIKEEYGIEHKSGLPVKLDDMCVRNGKLVSPCRIYVGMANRNKLEEFIANGCKEIIDDGMPLRFYINRNAAVRYRRLNDSPRNILSVLRNLGTTETSKTYLRGLGIHYDYPKPVDLVRYLVEIGCQSGDIVMDFFAGSCTTAEAVFRKNRETQAEVRFILVQLPAEIFPEKRTQKEAYDFCISKGLPAVLTEIGKERIRIASNTYRGDRPLLDQTEDFGFRVLKIDSSNMKDVYYSPQDTSQALLGGLIDNIKPDRSGEDLLFQVLLDCGVDLGLPIRTEKLDAHEVFFVNESEHAPPDLVACFDPDVSESLIKSIAEKKPLRAVFRDHCFAQDADKINVEQIFKQMSPGTQLKSL